MKNSIQILGLIVLFFTAIACGDRDKKSASNDKAPTTKKKELNKFEKRIEVLKTIEPVAYEDLEAWLPQSWGDLSLTKVKPFFAMFDGQTNLRADYVNKVNGQLGAYLVLMDAAGPKGTSFAWEIEEHQTKTPDVNAKGTEIKSAVRVKDWYARQAYTKDKNITQISFFHKDRIMIKLVASDLNVEESWDLIEKLDFNELSELIKE